MRRLLLFFSSVKRFLLAPEFSSRVKVVYPIRDETIDDAIVIALDEV